MVLPIIVTALVGYMLGNLNGAVSMSLLFNDDVRGHGSGNAGLTNFVRNFGYAKAGLVILIDALKAVLACMVGKLLFEPFGYGIEGMMLGALAVSLGHDFPALLGFKGGKGILSGFTIALTVDWRCALIILAVFVICLVTTRYVSLGSVLGAISLSVYFGFVYYQRPFVMISGIVIGLLAVFMHRSNIRRLLNGTENKQSFGKK